MPVPAALKALSKAITAREFAPVYYFHGDDDFRKDEALRRLIDAALDPALRDFNLEVRRGGDLDAETLGSLLGMPPMLADRRVIVVRDVDALKKDARAELERYLQRPASDTVLVLVAPAAAKADDMLKGATTAVPFATLDEDDLGAWIAKRAQAIGTTIDPEASALLQQFAGNDLHLLAAELEKLAAYAAGGAIDVDAVAAVVGVRPGRTLDDLLDAVARRDAATAAALVPAVLAQPKTTGVQIVMALATQVLAIGYLLARVDEGLSVSRLEGEGFALLKGGGGYTGGPWGPATKRWAQAVAKGWWSLDDVDRALDALLDADLSLKDSRVSGESQVLATLMLTLGTRRAGRAA
jgi:DNA polymerase-3 subunit delta